MPCMEVLASSTKLTGQDLLRNEAVAWQSQNTHADQTLQRDDDTGASAFLEATDFCALCGEDECSCDEEEVRMLVAEWRASVFSPNIPIYTVLTDFKRWSVREINDLPICGPKIKWIGGRVLFSLANLSVRRG